MQRRQFLKGMGCCAGIVAMSGSRVGNVVFGQGGPNRDIIISVFLRGGMDAMSFLVPYQDADYAIARPDLGLDSTQVLDLDGQFGLHPRAAGLKELYDSRHLGVVCAAGLTDPTRSHFEAQDFMDRGAPGNPSYDGGGWLARYLNATPEGSVFQGLSLGPSIALSLDGFVPALAMNGAEGFTLNGDSLDDVRRGLRRMWAEDPDLATIAQRTLDATDVVDFADPGNYVPSDGVTYPNGSFSDSLQSLAQLIKLDVGMSAATVDFGGWDTHNGQADSNPVNGFFANNVGTLSDCLAAFWNDLSAYHGRLTVVVMSEFGRRLKENDNRGTDHGHGGVMMVMNSSIVQKKVWGAWPGLAYEQLFENVDLAITTDFRQVLSEILYARLGYSSPDSLFPGYNYTGPVGLFGTAGIAPSRMNGVSIF